MPVATWDSDVAYWDDPRIDFTGADRDPPPTRRQLRLEDGDDVFDFVDCNLCEAVSADIGSPEVRQVITALPTIDGNWDTTRLLGPRTVTIAAKLVPTGQGKVRTVDKLARLLDPRRRPRLYWMLDDPAVALDERYLTVRYGGYSQPYVPDPIWDLQVTLVAPDPIIRAFRRQTTTIPPGGEGYAVNRGSYLTWPLLHIWGPCTAPVVTWEDPAGGRVAIAGESIAAGHRVEVDTQLRTVALDGSDDPAFSWYRYLDFAETRWQPLRPGETRLSFAASASAEPARVEVDWVDAWI